MTPVIDNGSGGVNYFSALVYAALVECVYRNDRATAEEIILRVGRGEITYWVSRPQVDEPSYAVWQSDNDTVFIICGVENGDTLLAYYFGSYTAVADNIGTITNGFANQIYQGTIEVASSQLPAFNGHNRVRLVGHSFGSHLATMASIDLVRLYGANNVSVLTLEPPKPFATGFNRILPTSFLQIVDDLDPVVFVPTQGQAMVYHTDLGLWLPSLSLTWRHITPLQSIQDDGSFIVREASYYDTWRNFQGLFNGSKFHATTSVMRKIYQGWANNNPLNSEKVVAGICYKIATGEEPPDLPAVSPVVSYVNFADANKILYQNSANSVLSSGNYNSSVYISGTITADAARTITNIADLGGFTQMPDFTNYKITMLMGNGQVGKSESHVYHSSAGLQDAINTANLLAGTRAQLLGNTATTRANNVKFSAAWHIDFLRIADANSPRKSFLVDNSGSLDYYGYASASNGAADRGSTTITLRLSGLNSVDGVTTSKKTLIICGQKDDVFMGGYYTPDTLVRAGQTFDQTLLGYLNFLTSGSQAFGYMGQSAAEPVKVVQSVALVSGSWQLTIPGHGYNTGETLRLKSFNNSVFNRTTKVSVVSSDVIALVNQPATSSAIPTFGRVVRIATTSGQRLTQFYRYQTMIPSNSANHTPKLGARINAREFNPVSFRHRKRRK